MHISRIREGARRALERQGYRVTDIGSGSGVPKNARLRIEKAGKIQDCVVKVGAKGNGRIHFVRDADGTYKVLSDMDLVIHADTRTEAGGEVVRVMAFSRETILNAFERTRIALEKEGKETYEIWLSPDRESQSRFLGSGYGKAALWSCTVDMSASSVAEPPLPTKAAGAEVTPQSVAQVLTSARLQIAALTGMPPEAIHLDLKMGI